MKVRGIKVRRAKKSFKVKDLTKIAGGLLLEELEAGNEEEIWGTVTESPEDWEWVDNITVDERNESHGMWDGYAKYRVEDNSVY